MAPKRAPANRPEVGDYRHDDERLNIPPAGLMAEVDETAPAAVPRTRYEYDPHLDPQLVWSGKKEHTSFEVDSVPLYIHERISTQAILRAVKREEVQRSLFADPELPLHEAVESYRHPMDWTNRLVLGDSLLVMNSLLERERMAGQVQMIYIDPPYGIGYNSNFQPRVDKRDVKDGADEDLTREPEQIRAYRDTWTLGIHSYLSYLRDRLLLAKDLLSERGSVFVQIGYENTHLVRALLDEVFGSDNFLGCIVFRKMGGLVKRFLPSPCDQLLWYGRSRQTAAWYPLYLSKHDTGTAQHYNLVELGDGTRRTMTADERANPDLLPTGARIYQTTSLGAVNPPYEFQFRGKTYVQHWNTSPQGMERLAAGGRVLESGNTLRYMRYLDDFPLAAMTDLWDDTMGAMDMTYAVQTNTKVIERCMLMATRPGDLVLDPTCGSGTTAYVAEQWGRRWITCDTSRVAVFLARQRLLTARFDYYDLADGREGLDAGFRYKTVPHITLKSIANNPELDPDKVAARREALRKQHPKASDQEIDRLLREANEAIIRANADQETLYDQPLVVRNKVRVSGPFTVEAIPPPSLAAMQETPIGGEPEAVGAHAVGGAACEASGPPSGPGPDGAHDAPCGPSTTTTTEHIETLIEQLRKDGVQFPDNKRMTFGSLTGCGSGVIHAEGEPSNGGTNGLKRVAISFGPLYGSVTGHQVEDGVREARVGGYDGIIFCGFAFDAEAQANISHYANPKVKAFIAHIRPDMLMSDLLKVTPASQLFTVFGEPEVALTETGDGNAVELLGVDVYDPVTGSVSSARGDRVAAWFVDTDYDGRTFCVCQAFFPDTSAWDKLGRALKGQIDPDKFEMLSGTKSLPFTSGKHKRVAIKVIDRRGNEVMVVRPL